MNRQIGEALMSSGEIGGYDFVAAVNQAGGVEKLRGNATSLLPDEWKRIDRTVIQVAQPNMPCIQSLRKRASLIDTFDAFKAMTLGYDRASDTEDAELVMELEERTRDDRAQFDRVLIPAPFAAKSFRINSRALAISRNGGGEPLDTLNAALASAKVAQRTEKNLVNGSGSYKAGGGTLYGYTDHPNRITGSLGTAWTSETGDNIVAKVCAMMQAAIDKNHYGPFELICPTAYSTSLNKDVSTSKDKSIVRRIREIDGIDDVVFSPVIAANNVVLVEMLPTTIQLAIGLDITNIPVVTPVGSLRVIIAACMIAKIVVDQNGQTGLVHYS